MIPVKNLSSTCLVGSAEIMVCYLENWGKFIFYEADEAVAHRQCARNSDALKPDDGNYPDTILL
jgi:hypothetical protein